MTENEFLLQDRITKIKSVIGQYGEENFYVSFSGGKDSTVLSALVDMAIPGNTIPRVYANTGIEYRMILEFVKKEKEKDHPWELVILKPKTPIKPMLEEVGYPFKSKYHSKIVSTYQRSGEMESVLSYTRKKLPKSGIPKISEHLCPLKLMYQFQPGFDIKISAKCCNELKKKPLREYQKINKKSYAIIGIMPDEGGERVSAKCLAFTGQKLKAFQPLVPVTKAWEDWFISKYNIDICDIYKPPYNFVRTGCKGCPFALQLQNELDVLEKYFPEEWKQCEIIWKPIYQEYRRIGYRLREENPNQITIDDFFNEGK